MGRLSTLKSTIKIIDTRSTKAKAVERLRGRPAARMRARILARDNYLCQACLRGGMVTVADEVDHVVPLHLGGSNGENNQESICRACHSVKSESERAERSG